MRRGPFERAPGYGFRLAKYIRPLPPAVAAPVRIEALVRDAREQKPVSDAIFAVYRRQYAYDRAPLNAVVEATEETEIWRKDTVVSTPRTAASACARISSCPRTSRRRTRPSSFFPRETHSACDRAATCRFAGWTSSSGAGERSFTRCTRGPTSGRRSNRWALSQNVSSELRGREISDAPSTISKRDRTSIGLVLPSMA